MSLDYDHDRKPKSPERCVKKWADKNTAYIGDAITENPPLSLIISTALTVSELTIVKVEGSDVVVPETPDYIMKKWHIIRSNAEDPVISANSYIVISGTRPPDDRIVKSMDDALFIGGIVEVGVVGQEERTPDRIIMNNIGELVGLQIVYPDGRTYPIWTPDSAA